MHEWFECNFFYFLNEKSMFNSHEIKSDHRVPRKNQVDTHKAPVFTPDYGSTGFAAIM
jgi:hypothetical protein